MQLKPCSQLVSSSHARCGALPDPARVTGVPWSLALMISIMPHLSPTTAAHETYRRLHSCCMHAHIQSPIVYVPAPHGNTIQPHTARKHHSGIVVERSIHLYAHLLTSSRFGCSCKDS